MQLYVLRFLGFHWIQFCRFVYITQDGSCRELDIWHSNECRMHMMYVITGGGKRCVGSLVYICIITSI